MHTLGVRGSTASRNGKRVFKGLGLGCGFGSTLFGLSVGGEPFNYYVRWGDSKGSKQSNVHNEDG